MRRSPLLALVALAAALLFAAERASSPPVSAASTCLGFATTIEGTPAGETIIGTPGDDVINGLAGDDIIYGMGGNDTICGDAGADTIDGGDGNDVINGGADVDTAIGGPGDDTIGADIADYASAPGPINASSTNAGATGTITGDGTDTASSVTAVYGSPFDDLISGFLIADGLGGNDTLTGDKNQNKLFGGAGDDSLFGLGGRDTLTPGPGDDAVDGGNTPNGADPDYDTVDYAPSAAGITMTRAAETFTVTGEGTDTLTAIEQVNGSTLADTMNIDLGWCTNLSGGPGDDHFMIRNSSGCAERITPGPATTWWMAVCLVSAPARIRPPPCITRMRPAP